MGGTGAERPTGADAGDVRAARPAVALTRAPRRPERDIYAPKPAMMHL
ncbi:protein of unknown function [Streptomyces murinus]